MYITTSSMLVNESVNSTQEQFNRKCYLAQKTIANKNYWWQNRDDFYDQLGKYYFDNSNDSQLDYSDNLTDIYKEHHKTRVLMEFDANKAAPALGGTDDGTGKVYFNQNDYGFLTYNEMNSVFDSLPDIVTKSDIEYLFTNKNYLNEMSKNFFIDFELKFINERKQLLKYCKDNNLFLEHGNNWNIFLFPDSLKYKFILRNGMISFQNDDNTITTKTTIYEKNKLTLCEDIFPRNKPICILNNSINSSVVEIMMLQCPYYMDEGVRTQIDIAKVKINACFDLDLETILKINFNRNHILSVTGFCKIDGQFLPKMGSFSKDFSKHNFWTNTEINIKRATIEEVKEHYSNFVASGIQSLQVIKNENLNQLFNVFLLEKQE